MDSPLSPTSSAPSTAPSTVPLKCHPATSGLARRLWRRLPGTKDLDATSSKAESSAEYSTRTRTSPRAASGRATSTISVDPSLSSDTAFIMIGLRWLRLGV